MAKRKPKKEKTKNKFIPQQESFKGVLVDDGHPKDFEVSEELVRKNPLKTQQNKPKDKKK